MKRSTILNKGRPLTIPNKYVHEIRKGRNSIIVPITNLMELKEKYNSDEIQIYKDKYYFYTTDTEPNKYAKENNTKFYTSKSSSKELSRVYIKVISSSVLNIQELSEDMINNLVSGSTKLDKKLDYIKTKMWDIIINQFLILSTKNVSQRTILYKNNYKYDVNPTVQYITFEKVELES